MPLLIEIGGKQRTNPTTTQNHNVHIPTLHVGTIASPRNTR
jgi:hypothetical protein